MGPNGPLRGSDSAKVGARRAAPSAEASGVSGFRADSELPERAVRGSLSVLGPRPSAARNRRKS
eukprot:7421839-Alexandrium_andersonii.AAC.1